MSGFEYDIFVSFAKLHDDLAWARALVRSLQERIAELLDQPESELSIWLDVGRGAIAQESTRAAVAKAAVLLVLQSPAWLRSAECVEECAGFLSRGGDATQSIFVVELARLDDKDKSLLPFEADPSVSYAFWSNDPSLGAERLHEPTDREFDAMLNTLAYDLADELGRLKTAGEFSVPSFGIEEASGKGTMDDVQFSAFAPKSVSPGDTTIVEIIAYLRDQRREALQMRCEESIEVGKKAGVKIERDTDICVHLQCPGLIIEDNVDTIYWAGEVASAAFIVEVPGDAKEKTYFGTARFVVRGVQIAKLPFSIVVGQADTADTGKNRTSTRPIRSVFASYSSQDRLDVLKWKRGAESVGVDVFVDVATLRQGDNWADRLREEITKCDLFCLFWSEAASKSEWVEKEWRQALDEKGGDFIQPVPLVDPRDVPPPEALGQIMHFEDISRIGIAYESTWRESNSEE